MFSRLQRWWQARIIRRSPVSDAEWARAFAGLPLLTDLSESERRELRDLAILFLHDKTLTGAGGLEVSRDMALQIALQACLPVLRLGLDWYSRWSQVIVYPDSFVPRHSEVDEAGVVHEVRRPLEGESWQRGPVILSWRGASGAGTLDGANLVIHEFAHKLDMRTGTANGRPPLHRDMSPAQWARVLSAAFDDFRRRLDADEELPFDAYAAESPAEFFAVLSEVFFEWPEALHESYPAVYEQLRAFYRQDPLARHRGSTA